MSVLASPELFETPLCGDPAMCALMDLQSLVDRCMGNLALADRLICRFKEYLAHSATGLAAAIEHENVAELQRLAHRLRGEAANLGAASIEAGASDTEELARFGQPDEACAGARELIVACRHFVREAFSLSELASPASR
jgi:HPt (histidine-containing phosphotransfer) domain-containing protein